jgi:hypothetical protein
MKTLLAIAYLLALAGCGADGAPTAPTKSGVSVSGDLQIGVKG